MRTLITGGTIVNEGRTFPGSVLIEDGNIVAGSRCRDSAFSRRCDV